LWQKLGKNEEDVEQKKRAKGMQKGDKKTARKEVARKKKLGEGIS